MDAVQHLDDFSDVTLAWRDDSDVTLASRDDSDVTLALRYGGDLGGSPDVGLAADDRDGLRDVEGVLPEVVLRPREVQTGAGETGGVVAGQGPGPVVCNVGVVVWLVWCSIE